MVSKGGSHGFPLRALALWWTGANYVNWILDKAYTLKQQMCF